jgi:type III restriction enzyme
MLTVPDAFVPQLAQIAEILRKSAGRLDIKNADERRQVPTRQAVLHSPEFKALWDRIKHKTTYRVHFDNAQLVQRCIDALREGPPITKTRLQWRKADIAIGKSGIAATEREGAKTVVLDEADIDLPDVLTDLQDRTQLTRRTIAHILKRVMNCPWATYYRRSVSENTEVLASFPLSRRHFGAILRRLRQVHNTLLVESGRLGDFKCNPQQFIDLAAETINRCKRLAVVDGIKYQRLGDDNYYAQELFEQEELTGYLMGFDNQDR